MLDYHESDEGPIAQNLDAVQVEHRASFIGGISGIEDPEALDAFVEEMRSEWRPLYQEAALEGLMVMERESISLMREEMGITDGDGDEDTPEVLASERLERHGNRIGTEAYDDVNTALLAQYVEFVENEEDPEEFDPSVLALSTLAGFAVGAVAAAFNTGREKVVEFLQSTLGSSEEQIIATRTAVMDNNTCEQCEALHDTSYIYDSPEYHENKPPLQCVWVRNCRCVCIFNEKVDV